MPVDQECLDHRILPAVGFDRSGEGFYFGDFHASAVPLNQILGYMVKIHACSCVLIMVFVLSSCHRSRALELPEDMLCVDRSGVIDTLHIHDGKKVVQFLSAWSLKVTLETTPPGKIDEIIRNNPDWQFIFYINCRPEEKAQIPKILEKFNCRFPVLLDDEARFLKLNKMDEEYTAIGFILDSRNAVVGMGIIGTSMSFFDGAFAKAKRVAR